MRTTAKSGGLTVRAIAGTYNVLIGIDLDPAKRAGCLGFTISRADAGGQPRFLPNRITFASTPQNTQLDTSNSPLQKFRWGDYTTQPGTKYRYTVTARYGKPGALTNGDSATVEVTTEDPKQQATPIFFNRGAAASQAYNDKFGPKDPDQLGEPQRTQALAWLSRGLEEAILAFQAQATDKSFGLHAAVYEFQKPNLLNGLKQALDRGVAVEVVYHYRHKNAKDKTWTENEAAAKQAGLTAVCTQRKQDPGVIMHNKFMVLLKGAAPNAVPVAVWTGSTNWTDGGLYGQLNVGHAVYDANVAKTYEAYFQLLKKDLPAAQMKPAVAGICKVPTDIPAAGVTPILSPQPDRNMLSLYHAVAQRARCLLVSAPFELADEITSTFDPVPKETLHYLLLDKEASLGAKSEIDVVEHNAANSVAFAATLQSNLTSFQDKLLKDSRESYHHAGVHIHSKIIVADPFGDDPVLVTGSANFSTNSTIHNDSNSLVVRGDKGVVDIYATEFMRMFEHYHFRAANAKAKKKAEVITLSDTDAWSQKWYVDGSDEALDRMLFAGTLPAADLTPNPVTAFKAAAGKAKAAPAKKKAASTKKAVPAKKKTASSKKNAGPAKKKAAPAKKKAAAKKKAPAKKKVVPRKKKVATTKKKVAITRKKASPPKKKTASTKKAPSRKKSSSKKSTNKSKRR